jgi:hypothetical protein
MNKYKNKATLIIILRVLLIFLYCFLFYMFTRIIYILTFLIPLIYVLILQFWCDWEELVYKFKHQDK